MQIIEEHIFEEVIPDGSDKFVLKGVKLIGLKSDNGRKYPLEVLKAGTHLYEDVPVYLGHNRTGNKRIYTERVGVIKNPYCKENGLYGELHLNPFHSQANSLQWDYEHNSKRVGLSHDADCTHTGGVVKKLNAIYSVDLVTEPATTETLKEEKEVDEISKIKSELSELNIKIENMGKDNQRLLEEIEDLKKVKKQVTSFTPQYIPEKKIDIDSWAKSLREV